ncbi:hypothetical protein BGX34_002521 [Mortierella sp. NVP85]|nr:hypothetical protein BGX34_002521 [Mortierella sp. NVP85]
MLQTSLEVNPGILANHRISDAWVLRRGVEALLHDEHIVQDVLAVKDQIYEDTAPKSARGGNGGRKTKAPGAPKAGNHNGRAIRVHVSRKARASGARKTSP